MEIKIVQQQNKADINLPNQPFEIFGRMQVARINDTWQHTVQLFDKQHVTTDCFPQENYNYDAMTDCTFVGAYHNGNCVGLAILQQQPMHFVYLMDLKVNQDFRGRHVGKQLMAKCQQLAAAQGKGIFTHAQDNNLAACLFYLNSGFRIGGLDSDLYRHTKLQGVSDVIFYWEG